MLEVVSNVDGEEDQIVRGGDVSPEVQRTGRKRISSWWAKLSLDEVAE